MNRTVQALMLFAATASFILGIVLPAIRVDRLWVLTAENSLSGIVAALFSAGDYALAAVVGAVSIVFPATKLAILHTALMTDQAEDRPLPRWMHWLANWSMTDVVLVALVVFAAKTSGLANASTMAGLWFFALSAVLTAVLSRLNDRHN